MNAIVLDPVESKSELNEFLRLPAVLYAAMSDYTAPLTLERRGLLDPDKSAFFKHGRAQYWIARIDGRAVGRISAQIDNAQRGGTFDDAGMFGCLDAIDDPAVVKALLERAQAWLAEQGCRRAIGPCTLSMNGEPGLLVAGHAEKPLILVPWHPTYLAAHVEACGYAKCQDLHLWRMPSTPENRAAFAQKKHMRGEVSELSLRPLDFRNLDRDLDLIREVYNDAWKDNWGFVPLLPEDMKGFEADLKPFLRPEYGIIAEQEARPVGVALVMPNLMEITGDLGADPSPIGWIKLVYRRFFHRFRTGRIILLGVHSDYHRSIAGAVIAATMVEELTRVLLGINHDTEWIEAGWVLESNTPLRGLLRQYGFETPRTLRLYDKTL